MAMLGSPYYINIYFLKFITEMGMPNRHSTTTYLVRLDGRLTQQIAKVHDAYDGSSGMKPIWTWTPNVQDKESSRLEF